MCARGLSPQDIRLTLTYGQAVYDRGALLFRMGRKQIRRYRGRIDLHDQDGVQVVCDPDSGTVMTVYRNRDFRAPRTTHRPQRAPRIRR